MIALYKRHPQGLSIMRMPIQMLKVYDIVCEYDYIEIEGFKEIPIHKFALKGVEYNNIDIRKIPLKEYAKGFIDGYNTNLVPFVDNNDTRIEVLITESYYKGSRGFTETRYGFNEIVYEHETMYESGVFEGKRYKAWELIFQTPNSFLKYFETSKPPQNDKNTNEETATFENKIDTTSPIEIYNFFKKTLVDKKYLSDEDLKVYLKTAFELKTIPKTLFKLKEINKDRARLIFYVFYKDISQCIHGKQIEYAKLLSNYFEGFDTSTTQTNWAKNYKNKLKIY